MADIKELGEALDGSMELLICVLDLIKDGAQFKDVFHFIERLKNSPEFSRKLKLAIDGVEKVPAEIADLDMQEMIELAMKFIKYLPRISKALGK